MENANSYEYLEKIKVSVIEDLKKTAPAPSVQMQDVPRHGLGMTDEEEAELDDLDEDENKDVRMTQRQWEKSVARQDELYESDDEDIAQANGVHKTNGGTRRSILDYRNPHADVDMDSGLATPVRNGEDGHEDSRDEVMADEPTEELQTNDADKEEPKKDAAEVDDDGDVDMAEASGATGETGTTTIKSEEVEALPSPQAEKEKEKEKTPAGEAPEGKSDKPPQDREASATASPKGNEPAAATSTEAGANGDESGDKAVEAPSEGQDGESTNKMEVEKDTKPDSEKGAEGGADEGQKS